MEKTKQLAKKAYYDMWINVVSPETYVFGGCSFCQVAQENCSECLLPKFYCEKVDGRLKTNTLISVIRSSFKNPVVFNEILFLIKTGLRDLMVKGKLRRYTKKLFRVALNGKD